MDKVIIRNLSVRYSDGTESLKNISFNIPANAVTVLFGPAGGGKSTLLRTLNRLNDLADLDTVDGEVFINDKNILDPETNVIELRRKVGMVFSRPVPLPLSIYDNVAYALTLAGVKNRAKLDEKVEQALRRAVLWDEVHDRLKDPAAMLSGGQKQRLCIARSLALEPEIIMLDEPTSALDPSATASIEELMHDLKKRVTILIVTHNMQQAARISDHTAYMYLGDLIEFGKTDEIFIKPRDKRTEDYITGRLS